MVKKTIDEDESIYEEIQEEDYDPTGGLKDTTPQDVIDIKEESNETEEEMDQDEINATILLTYKKLLKKQKKGEMLTPEELAWKKQIEEMHEKEKSAEQFQQEELEKEKLRQAELQEQVNKEYLKTKEQDPSKIVTVTQQEATLTGAESIPKILSLVFQLKKARKKGGKLLVQVFRNRKVIIKWTRSDVNFIEFISKDEKGNHLSEVTRFSEYKYMFEGTPIPVLFAVQGYAEGFDFFSEFRKDLTSEVVSRLVMRSYIAGYTKGAEIKQKEVKKGMLDSLQPLMPLIIIGGFILTGYLLYTMYGEMQTMIEAMNALKAQLNVVGQVVS